MIYIIFAFTTFFMGFTIESRGSIFTETIKTRVTGVNFSVGLVAVFYSIFSGWYWGILVTILLYFFVTGIGAAFCRSLRK